MCLITTLTVSSVRGLVPVAIFIVLIYTVSRVPLRRVLSSMAPLLAIVVVVAVLNLFTDQSGLILWQLGFLQISEGSLHSAGFMACRLTLMMAGMSAITLTTPTLVARYHAGTDVRYSSTVFNPSMFPPVA